MKIFCFLLEFLCKECPKIHIHIDRIDKKDVPEEQAFMRRWLHERFEIKDKWVTAVLLLRKLGFGYFSA